MNILALDLGTHTGWALRSRDGSISSGVEDFTATRFSSGGMKFLLFKKWLEDLQMAVGGIDVLYFEEVRRHLGVDAAHCYGAFMGQLTTFCETHHIPYQGISVSVIKKFATGKGNSGKDEMMAAAQAAGFQPKDDNEADALHLLRYVLETVHN